MTADYQDLPLFRASDPVTSQQGAAHIRPKIGSQMHRLLIQYGANRIKGMTDEQACIAAGLTIGGWKRCSDLRRLGLIEPTGETRTGTSGVEQRVCRITADGWEAIK